MSCRDQDKRKVELPSGAEVVIKKLTGMDVALLRARGMDPKKLGVDQWTVLQITELCGLYVRGEERLRIVNKDWRDCTDGEIALTELPDADALAIVTAINDLAADGKERATQSPDFQAQESGATAERSSAGEAVRATAVEPTLAAS